MRIHSVVFGTLLLVLIMSASVGYSMWIGRLRVNVSVHMADDDKPFIDSYKGFICCETTSCCDHDHCHDNDHDCEACSNDQDSDSTNNIGVQCHNCHLNIDCDCKGLEDSQMSLINDGRTMLITDLECEDDCHCCCHSHHDDSSNDVTLQNSNDISIQCNHCDHDHYTNMSLWIGLVIKHEGEVPVKFTGVSVIINGDYDDINVNYYAYGPFTTSFQQVWGHVDPCSLPFSGYSNSIVLDENEKMILWINVRLTDTSSISSVTVTPTFENWNE